jgi:hypothetical protein
VPEFLERARTLHEIAQALREIASSQGDPDQRVFILRLADDYDQRAEAEQLKSTVKMR